MGMISIFLYAFSLVGSPYRKLDFGGNHICVRGPRVRVHDLNLLEGETAFFRVCHPPRGDGPVEFRQCIEVEGSLAILEPVWVGRPEQAMAGTSSTSCWYGGNFREVISIWVKGADAKKVMSQVRHHKIGACKVHDHIVAMGNILCVIRA